MPKIRSTPSVHTSLPYPSPSPSPPHKPSYPRIPNHHEHRDVKPTPAHALPPDDPFWVMYDRYMGKVGHGQEEGKPRQLCTPPLSPRPTLVVTAGASHKSDAEFRVTSPSSASTSSSSPASVPKSTRKSAHGISDAKLALSLAQRRPPHTIPTPHPESNSWRYYPNARYQGKADAPRLVGCQFEGVGRCPSPAENERLTCINPLLTIGDTSVLPSVDDLFHGEGEGGKKRRGRKSADSLTTCYRPSSVLKVEREGERRGCGMKRVKGRGFCEWVYVSDVCDLSKWEYA